MAKDGLTRRPWYRWCPRDFYTDPAVMAMEREVRWRYRDALDSAWLWDDPARGTEDEWREAMDYSTEEWEGVKRRVLRAMKRLPDGRWEQRRLRSEFEHATEKTRLSTVAAAERAKKGQRDSTGRWIRSTG